MAYCRERLRAIPRRRPLFSRRARKRRTICPRWSGYAYAALQGATLVVQYGRLWRYLLDNESAEKTEVNWKNDIEEGGWISQRETMCIGGGDAMERSTLRSLRSTVVDGGTEFMRLDPIKMAKEMMKKKECSPGRPRHWARDPPSKLHLADWSTLHFDSCTEKNKRAPTISRRACCPLEYLRHPAPTTLKTRRRCSIRMP